ncbi:MAG: hypothetical protein ACRD2O_10445 [Terriglobia bacterium]
MAAVIFAGPSVIAFGIDDRMQRKVFLMSFIALSVIADLALPLLWGLLATFPIIVVSWWIAYRSDWF